jgi:hypothetical protein
MAIWRINLVPYSVMLAPIPLYVSVPSNFLIDSFICLIVGTPKMGCFSSNIGLISAERVSACSLIHLFFYLLVGHLSKDGCC